MSCEVRDRLPRGAGAGRCRRALAGAELKAARVCPTPDCPEFMPCAEHARPNAHQRGYTRQHKNRRAQALRDLAARPGRPCPWCGTPMHAGMALDWDHTKQDLTCARCNRADGGRRAHTN